MTSSSTNATTFLSAKSFDANTPALILSRPYAENYGERYNITSTEKGGSMVLAFSAVAVKVCINDRKHAFLAVQEPELSPITKVLEELRVRFAKDLNVDIASFRPILSTGGGIFNRRASLCLNILDKATLKDTNQQPMTYDSIVKKTCKMGLFLQLHSVFKNSNDNQYSVLVKVTQMIHNSTEEPVTHPSSDVSVECEDPSELL